MPEPPGCSDGSPDLDEADVFPDPRIFLMALSGKRRIRPNWIRSSFG